MSTDILKDIQKDLQGFIDSANFEGANIVIYTNDIEFFRDNQGKIRELVNKYKKRIELLNPLIRGLIGEKMSSSIEATKIDTLDDEKTVKKKINKAECVPGDINNGLMALLKYFIMVLKEDKKEKFIINRPEKFGGKIIYNNYVEIEKDFIAEKLHPMDLKMGVADEINIILKNFRTNKKLIKLHEAAYKN